MRRRVGGFLWGGDKVILHTFGSGCIGRDSLCTVGTTNDDGGLCLGLFLWIGIVAFDFLSAQEMKKTQVEKLKEKIKAKPRIPR